MANPACALALLRADPVGPMRVLVADDNPLSGELVSEHLRLAGFSVDSASDGAEAVEKAASGRYGLLLLDINMPRMDGVHVVARLRDLMAAGGLKVIVMTADRLGSRRVELTQNGIDAYLTKPIRLDRLDGEISRLLAG